jgi:hypothetical protein
LKIIYEIKLFKEIELALKNPGDVVAQLGMWWLS